MKKINTNLVKQNKMWRLLLIKHVIGETFQVTDENETIVYYQGSFEDCKRYKGTE